MKKLDGLDDLYDLDHDLPEVWQVFEQQLTVEKISPGASFPMTARPTLPSDIPWQTQHRGRVVGSHPRSRDTPQRSLRVLGRPCLARASSELVAPALPPAQQCVIFAAARGGNRTPGVPRRREVFALAFHGQRATCKRCQRCSFRINAAGYGSR